MSKFRMIFFLSYFYLYYFLVFHIESSLASCDSRNCVNGYCNTGDECICYDGWEGVKCDHCIGRVRLLEPSGYIRKSLDVYTPHTKCSWLIDSQRNDTPIHLKLEEFQTQCYQGRLYIFDGDSIYSPLVAVLSGPIQYQKEAIRNHFKLTSGFAYLYFYGDNGGYTRDGFSISYRIGDCRDRNCSGNGICRTDTFNCECFPGWSGDGCSIPDCPNNCSKGDCINGRCVCDNGYYGRGCNTEISKGLWEILDDRTVFNRASAASAVIGDELWLIGGYGFIKEDSMPVFKYNFISGVSESVPVTSSSGSFPRPRYAHSAALYKDVVIIYGGNILDGAETSEVWILNTTTLSWSDVMNINSTAKAMQGHTAHVINDSMLVFFGYNPIYGYVGWVQEYDILNNSWSILQTGGSPVLGAFGHSSVYHLEMQKVFVYGGYPFNRLKDFPGDPFYEFDVVRQKWSILPSAGQSRFLHSAVLIVHKMYVFGGKRYPVIGWHTDDDQCYSNHFKIYDIDCNSWHEEELSTGLYEHISRFGHQAVVYNDVMWLFGGYNGVILNDILTYTTVNCSALSKKSCELAGPGPTCMWNMDSDQCIKLSSKETSHYNVSLLKCDPTENYPNCFHITSCSSCILSQGCDWCDGKCRLNTANESNCYTCEDMNCQFYSNCEECNRHTQCRYTRQGCNVIDQSEVPRTGCRSCSTFTSCSDCTRSSCTWCESQNRCIDPHTSFLYGVCLARVTKSNSCNKIRCSDYVTCRTCNEDPACGWCDRGVFSGFGMCMDGSYTGPVNVTSVGAVVDVALCPSSQWYFDECPKILCSYYENCDMCNEDSACGWCDHDVVTGLGACIDGSYAGPVNETSNGTVEDVGLCSLSDWYFNRCPKIPCSYYLTCDTCLEDPVCGWCYQSYVIGFGTCMKGGEAGPVNLTSGGSVADLALCPLSNWYFTRCPICQCNGHSICLDGETCSNCSDFTTGDHCESCILGYHGTPLNGANCSICECSGHTEYCDPNSNENICYCDTRGIVGRQCERCDEGYYGDPTVNTCYYQLSMNNIHKIQIFRKSEKNITKMNMFVQPDHFSRDIDFFLSVNKPVIFSVSYTTSTLRDEEIIIDNIYLEGAFNHSFSPSTYNFINNTKTTFLFYLSNFTQPFTFTLLFGSVKVVPSGNSITIIIVTCVVFFVLILTGFIFALKGRQHLDRYRRQRQCDVELVEMAKRPFASIYLEIESKAPPYLLAPTESKPSTSVDVAIEPLRVHNAALATVILQLPFSDGEVPVGQQRVTFATALVIQKYQITDSDHQVPEFRELPSPRETQGEQTPNGRPNTACDIDLICDEIPSEEFSYTNPVLV